ncbi:hypothetical protein [Salibacterium lacus]|uniref:Uncharacterized protein n=1 Tax=Salibacterium lacus TaxID=1898109 RepID=A0ABW5SX60_9BACI
MNKKRTLKYLKNIFEISIENKLINFFCYILIYMFGIGLSVFVLRLLGESTYFINVLTATSNFFGGILGGLIAYVVAVHQIESQKDEEKIKELQNISNMITLLQSELKHNELVLSQIKEKADFNDKVNSVTLFNTDIWHNAKYVMAESLNQNTFENINDHYRELDELKNCINPDLEEILNNQIDYRMLLIQTIRRDLSNVHIDI